MDRLLKRREVLRSSAGILGAAALQAPTSAEWLLRSISPPGSEQTEAVDDRMIVYSRKYLTLEMPMSLLNSWITPADSFFVRNNLLMPPAIDPSAWTLSITGEVERPFAINFKDFMQLATSKVVNTLECAGNSRVNFQPPIGGVRWGRGAVGNAAFEGPALGDVLRRAGLKSTAKHVAFRGLDVVPPGASEFIRSIPIEKAMDRGTLLATKMNDSPLTPPHGFPVRAMVPGWIGSASIKWLQEIRVLSHEFQGFYMDPGYRVPAASFSGSGSEHTKTISLTSLRVKSIIAQPADGAVLDVSSRPQVTSAPAPVGQVSRLLSASKFQPTKATPGTQPRWILIMPNTPGVFGTTSGSRADLQAPFSLFSLERSMPRGALSRNWTALGIPAVTSGTVWTRFAFR